MKTMFANVKVPALFSLAIIFPFMLMELIKRNDLPGQFPYVLFGALWVAMLLIVLILRPILKKLYSGILNFTILYVITRIVLLSALSYFWISIIIDQLPCFMGVANCD